MAILTTNYNALQARISKIFGIGVNEFGYGQTLTSFPLNPTVPAVLSNFQNLRTDILAARYHQIGVPVTPPIAVLTNQITSTIWAQFLSVMTAVETSKLVVPAPTQGTREVIASEETPNNTWNNTSVHEVVVEFDDADHMRHYFNTGSSIEFKPSSVNTASNSKSVAWNSLLNSVGVISFKQAATTSTKSVGSLIGYSSLTNNDQLVFQKIKADTPAASIFKISARKDDLTIIFTIEYINTGANVTSVLHSNVGVFYATGSYVEIAPPVMYSSFTAGESKPTFSLAKSISTINETNLSVTFTVTTTNFADGLLYFSIFGTSITALDFDPSSDLTPGTLSGTVSIVGNTGTFVIVAAADLYTEGKEQFQVQLRADSEPKSAVVAQLTSLEIITDTSLTPPAPTYTILPLSTTAVTEGQTILYRIVTKNVKDGTDLYWSTKVITPSLQSSDFVDNRLNGVVTVYGNLAEIYRTIYEDTISETTAESYQIVLSVVDPNTGLSKTVQTSELVRISDKISIEPPLPYVVLNDEVSIPEDSTTKLTFVINTPKLPNNTKLYWKTIKDNGVLAANDFTDNTLTGSVVISNNTGVVIRKAKKDSLTEGNETFHLSFYSDVLMTKWVVDSDVITISETVQYVLTRTPATMAESTTSGALGAGVTFTLTTPWLLDGTILYWTTVSKLGVVQGDDFTDGAIDGIVVISGNTGTILRRAAKDGLVEGTEEFHLEIRQTAGTSGPILVTSQTTSITEIVPYEIIPTKSYIVENQAGVDFTITTPFLTNGTVLYWETVVNTGLITASDFTDNRLAGTVEINGNTGIITRTAALDALTEGKESFRLILKTGSAPSTKVATSTNVTIGETVQYTITPSAPSFIEGQAGITVNFTTPYSSNGTKVYWTILTHAGSITGDDFIVSDAQGGSGQRLNGYAIVTNNKGSFIISARRDTITEEPETFQIELRIDSILGPVQVTSTLITLNEIVPYVITPNVLSVNEGGSVRFDIITPWIADSEKKQLNWTTHANSGTINTTDFPDFTDANTGAVIVKGNSAQVIRTVCADKNTESGVDAFSLKLWDTSGNLLATSSVVTINDTSQTVVVPDPAEPTYVITPNKTTVIEGDSVTFTIATTDVSPTTPLFWTLFRGPGLTANELLQLQSSAPFNISYNNPGTSDTSGHASVTVTSIANSLIESDRAFLFELRTGSVAGTIVATSSLPVMLVDATPYLIKADNSTITEGSQTGVRFDITTPLAAYGTTMTWTIVPELGSSIDYNDFDGLSSLSGTVSINQFGAGNFTLTAAANAPKELNESFHIELTPQGSQTRVTLGAPSPIIKITETQFYTLIASAPSIVEGSSVTFTLSTPKLTVDTTYNYRIVGVKGNIEGADFSPSGLTGSVNVTSVSSSQQFTILTTSGGIEGEEQFQIEITLASTGQLVNLNGGSPTVTITENTPYKIKERASSVKEGNTIVFDVSSPLLSFGSQLLCEIKPTVTNSFSSQDLDIQTLTPRVTLLDGINGTLAFVPKDDGTTKGDRPFTVRLYDINEGNYVVSGTVTITDAPAQTVLQPNTAQWRLNPTSKVVVQTNSIVFKLATSASITTDRVIMWGIQILDQLDTVNPNSNPFTGATGQVTLVANTATVNITIPTIVSPGMVKMKLSLMINYAPIAFTDDQGFNNTGIYTTTAMSGYAAEVVVVEKKPISIGLSKNQLINKTPDSFEVTITAPWYMTGYKVTVRVAPNSYWNPNGTTPEFLPVTQDVIVTSGFTTGMLASKQYSMPATGKCTISLNPLAVNNNLTGQAFSVTATNANDNILTTATPQPFNVIAKPSYTITTNKPSIDETPTNNTVRFTVTTPASATDITVLYWKVVGVDYKLLGLTSNSGSKTKDSSNSTWFDFTAIADQTTNIGTRQFYIEVRSTSTGAVLPFLIPCPTVTINDTSKNLAHSITINSIQNGNAVNSKIITMPVSASTLILMDNATGKLVINATVSPSFTNQTFTCTLTNATNPNIQAALANMNGTTLVTPVSATTNSSSQLQFEIKSIYRNNVVAGLFQFTIASVTEPTCTIVTETLEYALPNTQPPVQLFNPIMTIVKSTVNYNESSILTITGGKPGETGILTSSGAPEWLTGLNFSSGRSITLGLANTSEAGMYTTPIGTWKTGGVKTFSASFGAGSNPCTATLTVNPPPRLNVIASIKDQPSTLEVGSATLVVGSAADAGKSVVCQIENIDVTSNMTVTIETTNPLIRQCLGANTSTGVLPNPTNAPYFTTTKQPDGTYVVAVGLYPTAVTGLSGYLAFQVKFSTTNPYTNAPLFVSSTDITLSVVTIYNQTIVIDPPSRGSNGTSNVKITGGKPNSQVLISIVGTNSFTSEPEWFKGTLDNTGSLTRVYLGGNPGASVGTFTATFEDRNTRTATLTITDVIKTVTKHYGVSGIIVFREGVRVASVVVSGAGGTMGYSRNPTPGDSITGTSTALTSATALSVVVGQLGTPAETVRYEPGRAANNVLGVGGSGGKGSSNHTGSGGAGGGASAIFIGTSFAGTPVCVAAGGGGGGSYSSETGAQGSNARPTASPTSSYSAISNGVTGSNGEGGAGGGGGGAPGGAAGTIGTTSKDGATGGYGGTSYVPAGFRYRNSNSDDGIVSITFEYVDSQYEDNIGSWTPWTGRTISPGTVHEYSGTLTLNLAYDTNRTKVIASMTDAVISDDIFAQRTYYYVYVYGTKITKSGAQSAPNPIDIAFASDCEGFLVLQYADGQKLTVSTEKSNLPAVPSVAGAPSALSISRIQNTSMLVQWRKTTSPIGGSADRYTISAQHGTDTPINGIEPIYTTIDASGNLYSTTLSGLTQNTLYTITVTAINVSGSNSAQTTGQTAFTLLSQDYTGAFNITSTRQGTTNFVTITISDTIVSANSDGRSFLASYVSGYVGVDETARYKVEKYDTLAGNTPITSFVMPAGVIGSATLTLHFRDNRTLPITRSFGIQELIPQPPEAPGKPTSLLISAVSHSVLAIQWKAPASGGAVASYETNIDVSPNYPSTISENNGIFIRTYSNLQQYGNYTVTVIARNVTGYATESTSGRTAVNEALRVITGSFTTTSNTKNGSNTVFVVSDTTSSQLEIISKTAVYTYSTGGTGVTVGVSPQVNLPIQSGTGTGTIPYGIIGSAILTIKFVDGKTVTRTTEIGLADPNAGLVIIGPVQGGTTTSPGMGPVLLPALPAAPSHELTGGITNVVNNNWSTISVTDNITSATNNIHKKVYEATYELVDPYDSSFSTFGVSSSTSTISIPENAFRGRAYVIVYFKDAPLVAGKTYSKDFNL